MLKNNYIDWKQNLKTDPNWIPPIDGEFIPHILPILASIPLVKNPNNDLISAKLTYENIPAEVKTPNGTISGEQLKALIGFTAIARRSVLMPKLSQTKNPVYGLYTPLVLYAHKLYNDINYGSWDTTPNPHLHAFLGTTLFMAHASAIENGKPEVLINTAKVKVLRKEALTYKSGAKAGTQDKATAHRCNLQKLDVKSRVGDTKPQKYTKYAVMSFLQLWLCNAELRNSDSMILDFYDWDNTPKAYDAVFKKDSVVHIKPEKSELDKLWEL